MDGLPVQGPEIEIEVGCLSSVRINHWKEIMNVWTKIIDDNTNK